jgi:hypothetical protein
MTKLDTECVVVRVGAEVFERERRVLFRAYVIDDLVFR